jgi:hypothetical protein
VNVASGNEIEVKAVRYGWDESETVRKTVP